MIAHYFRFAFRNILRDRFISVINILGLSAGMACTLIIVQWVHDELNYDEFHQNARRLYRLTVEQINPNGLPVHFARTWARWKPKDFREYFPAIDQVTRFIPMRNTAVRIGDEKFFNQRFFACDSNVFKVFSLDLKMGDPARALTEPNCIVLSENIASKYFHKENPIGKMISTVSAFDTMPQIYRVTGVMKQIPPNSHLHADLLASISQQIDQNDWAYTYILIKNKSTTKDILPGLPEFMKKFVDATYIKNFVFHLQPIREIHLRSHKDREIEDNGNLSMVYIFSLVAFVIFIIALVNYANLTIASVVNRERFIRINQVAGAHTGKITAYFSCESILISIFSAIIAVIIMGLFLPWFNALTGKHLTPFSAYSIGWFGLFIALLLISGTFTGVFMAQRSLRKRISFISSFVGIQSLAIMLTRKRSKAGQALIIFQFTASIALINSILFISKQTDFVLSRRMGIQEDKIAVLMNLSNPVKAKYSAFKSVLLQSPYIKDVSACMDQPSYETLDKMIFRTSGNQSETSDSAIFVMPADENYFSFFNLHLLAGNDFPPYRGDMTPENFIINESALRLIGWKTPEEAIGKPFHLVFSYPGLFRGGTIIGVVEDFYLSSLKKPIPPMVFFQKPIWYWNFLVKIDSRHLKEGLKALEVKWNQLFPDYPFDYKFTDDLYEGIYKSELRMVSLLRVFCVLAVVISCMGLFGMSIIQIRHRTKEIGIRKVNGAAIVSILLLLSRDIFIILGFSIILATPLSWYLLHWWLEGFTYRIALSAPVFIFSASISLLIALSTVSWHAWRAAVRNPVEALRYE